MKKIFLYILTPALLLLSACESDFTNPNAAPEDRVLNSADGLMSMVNGLKFRYTIGGAGGLYSGISANGLTTKELRILNAGNAELAQLGNGFDNVAPSNAIITNLWTNLNLIRSDAEKLIENAPGVINDAGTRAGVVAYAHFFKALALGTMAQYWEQAPINSGENAAFSSRAQVLQEAVRLLEDATLLLNNNTISSAFNAKVGTDIDIRNALRALTARYYLMLGQWDNALSAANSVDLASKSQFTFDNVNPNPVFRSSLVTNNVYDVEADFGQTGDLAPDPNDGRIAFFLTPNAALGKGFFAADNSAVPVYLPGEMILAKAEALARTGKVGDAITELDKVLTKTDDIFGVNAGLPAYSGPATQDDVLFEIYKNRCIELYMSGLKLEDCRRFGRPGPESPANFERNRNFYPYPNFERDNNPNTPPDPEN
jgi:starch-binding outer membrane protein, SusD/RagB family